MEGRNQPNQTGVRKKLMCHHIQSIHQEMSVQTETQIHFPATRVGVRSWGLSRGQRVQAAAWTHQIPITGWELMNHGQWRSGLLTKFVIELKCICLMQTQSLRHQGCRKERVSLICSHTMRQEGKPQIHFLERGESRILTGKRKSIWV